MSWADPDAFRDDWALANAPQPHVVFDVFTFFAARMDVLAPAYLAYWVLALLVFGLATALVARRWASGWAWLAIATVSLWVGLAPVNVLGTGSPGLPFALPVVLAGFLLYLTVAALYVGHDRLAALAAIGSALAHVQQGVVAAVMLALVVLAAVASRRTWSRWLLVGILVIVAVVAMVLWLRPVANDPDTFKQVCDQLIAYHCDATTWPRMKIAGGFAIVALSLLTVRIVAPRKRHIWAAVQLLPAVALAVGLAADRYNLGIAGDLAQGTNVYRLAVLFIPWSAWGLLSPLIARGQRLLWLRWAVVSGLTLVALGPTGAYFAFALARSSNLVPLVLVGLAVGAAVGARQWVRHRTALLPLTQGAAALVVAGILGAAVAGSTLQVRPFDPTFFPFDEMRAWGERVRAVVPAGAQMITPPTNWNYRMALQRALVADCKYIPYGADAWAEYQERLDALGSLDACRTGDPQPFRLLTPAQLIEAADRYAADFIVLELPDPRVQDLRDYGWTEVVEITPGLPWVVLGRQLS